MILPSLKKERDLWRRGMEMVAGVDEVGMGCWAGPVVAAAANIKNKKLNIKNKRHSRLVRDSKLLDWKRREEAALALMNCDWLDWAVGVAEVWEVDKWGLGGARRAAMKRAIAGLENEPDFLLFDAIKFAEYNEKSESIIKGDAKIFSIACASIIAKVTRDRMMREAAQKYPYWGFDRHKGYGTEFHRAMIDRYGLCEMHRKTFEPVKEALDPSMRLRAGKVGQS